MRRPLRAAVMVGLLMMKISALLAYCGGPLVVSDVLGSVVPRPVAFGIGFAPVGLLLYGWLSIDDWHEDLHDDWSDGRVDPVSRWAVRGGQLGNVLLAGYNLFGVWRWATAGIDDAGLFLVGVVAGTGSSAAYVRRLRRPAPLQLTPPPSADDPWPHALSKPNLDDWGLLAIGLAFVAAGLFMLPSKPEAAIVTIVFFGTATLVPVLTLRRKLGSRKRSAQAEVALGVVHLRRRMPVLLSGLLCTVVGTTLVVFGGYGPLALRLIGGGVLFAGVGVTAACLRGWLPRGHLQVDAQRLTLAERGHTFEVPWNAVEALVAGELHSQPSVSLLVDPAQVRVTPTRAAPRAQRQLARNRAWLGADVVILPLAYGLDPVAFARLVDRHVHQRPLAPAPESDADPSC